MNPKSVILAGLLYVGTHGNVAAQSQPANPKEPSSTTQANSDSVGSFHPGAGTIIVTELLKNLETKKLAVGEEVECRVTQDLLYQGKVIIPHDARVAGRVTEAVASSKDQPESRLGLLFEKVILKDKRELSFQYPAVIVAIAPPFRKGYISTTRPDEMPVQMQKGTSSGGSVVGALSSNSSLAGANIRSTTGVISGADRGVINLRDLALKSTPQNGAVIVSLKGDIRLTQDTQFVLRVLDPKDPKAPKDPKERSRSK